MAEETIAEVWQFAEWRDVLATFGLKPIRGGIPSLRSRAAPLKPLRGGWSDEPESAEHQALKRWVAANPQILKSSIAFRAGKTEWTFASADRADVLFDHHDGQLAVEVKAAIATDSDLQRGICQCVKYQALVRAELKAEGKIPNGRAVLVSERTLPHTHRRLAQLLGVHFILVSRPR